MNEIEYKQMLQDAITKWGMPTQRLIWIEECAEFIQRLAKVDRYINSSFRDQVAEELADVDICLDQAKEQYPEYKEHKKRKIARLKRLVYQT